MNLPMRISLFFLLVGCSQQTSMDEAPASQLDAGSLAPDAQREESVVETLVSRDTDVYGLAVDAEFVYWAQGDSIWRVPLGGGEPAMIASDVGAAFHGGLDVHGNSVYFANVFDSGGYIGRAPKAGGSVEVLVDEGGGTVPWGIALLPSRVLWTRLSGGGGLWSWQQEQEPTKLADTFSFDIATSGDFAFVGSTLGEIRRVALSSGQVTDLTPLGDFSVQGLAVGDGSVYYLACKGVQCAEGSLQNVATNGGSPEVLRSEASRPNSIATSDGVYWTESGRREGGMPVPNTGALWFLPYGGEAVILADGLAFPTRLVVADRVAYWSDGVDRQISTLQL